MKRLLLLLALLPIAALAQTVPNGGLQFNQIWTTQQWINAWQQKVDVTNGVLTNPIFNSITGLTQCLHVNASGVVSGTGQDCGTGGEGGGGSVNFSSPDGSLAVSGSPGSSITATVNASDIATGIVPYPALPPLTGNTAYAAACQGNINTSGLAFIDNINVPAGNTVHLMKQTTATQNGPWVVSSGAWARPGWYPSGSTTAAVIGMSITVAPGTALSICGGQTYQLLFANGVSANPITIDSSTTSWFQTNNVSLPTGATIARSDNLKDADVANVLNFGSWSGTLRKNYGNSAPSGIACTASSSSVTLSSVTIPSSYNGATIALPGCGFPGAINDASNPGIGTQTFAFSAAGSGFYPKQIVAVSGGTASIPAEAIIYSTIVAAQPSIASAGSGCTNGTQTFTGTTGVAGSTGTGYFTVSGTVSGNVLTSINSFVANGPYYENPINLAAEPVTGGGCSVAPTLGLSMGANLGGIFIAGSYSATPSNPVSFAPTPLNIQAMTWASTSGGTATVTIATYTAGGTTVLPGFFLPGWTSGSTTFPVTIAGATPSGYNGSYTATLTGPNTFTFPLTSNPGTATVVGNYTVAPSATGAQVNFGGGPSWYGNPLVGTISNISGGSFTLSTPAITTQTAGLGKVYLWKGTDTAAFNAAIATGAHAIVAPSPPVVTGWESGYMLNSSGIALSAPSRRDFNCMGSFISGAANLATPNSGGMLTIGTASAFRAGAGSIVEECELDTAGGFARDFTNADWDWIVIHNHFENAYSINVGWSYGGHSRESGLRDNYIINDGYNPLTFPVMGVDSEALDTRIIGLNIAQGFQQTAIFSNTSTGDVNYGDIHAEQVVAGPIFTERGTGNHWLNASMADSPPPGFPGYAFYGGFNNLVDNGTEFGGTWAGEIGLLVGPSSLHNTITDNRLNNGGIPTAYICMDFSSSGLGSTNVYQANTGCPDNVLAYPKLNGVLPSLVAGTNVTISGTFPNQTVTASSTAATAFSGITSATNTAAAMVVGTGASLTTSGTGTNNANQVNGGAIPTSAGLIATNSSKQFTAVTTPLGLSLGGTGASTLAGASIPIFSGSFTTGDCLQAGASTTIVDSGAVCGGGGGSSAFNAITSGTNTAAAMLVGTGSSLSVTGTGTINANEVNGATVPASAAVLASNSSSQAVALTLAGNLAIAGGALVTSQGINVQTGTSYTILTADAGSLIEFNNGGSIAVSVPSAAATGFTAGFAFDAQDLNVGMITLTPAAGSIGGQSTYTMVYADSCTFTSDGTNWNVSGCTAALHQGTFLGASGTGTCATRGSTSAASTYRGQFTCTGTGGASTVTITLPHALNAWFCAGNDLTTSTDTLHQTASTNSSCTLSGTLAASDLINFQAGPY